MSSFTPLITIITPTYNREKFISEAIDSVLAQTYENWQLIIVDDGSTDDTKSVVDTYLTDSRISYYYQENQGQATARQFAFKQAAGEYIAFLDSDNRWFANRLALGIEHVQEFPDEVPYGDGVTIDEAGNEITRENMQRHSGDITALLVRDNFVSMNTTLIPKSAMEKIDGVRSDVKRGDDFDLYLRLSTVAKYKYIPEFMVEYRVMEAQISSNKEGRFAANIEVVEYFKKHFPNALSQSQFNRSLSSFYVRKARYYASVRKFSQAYKDIFHAITLAPLWVGTYRALLKIIISMFSTSKG